MRLHYRTESRHEFEAAIALLQPRVPPDDPELLGMRFDAARTLTGLFRPERALAALASAEAAAGGAALRGDTSLAMHAMRARLDILVDARQNAQALLIAERFIEMADRLAPTDLAQRFDARLQLSELCLRLGRKAQAGALIDELSRPPFGESGVGAVVFANLQLQQGREHTNEGRLDDGERLIARARATMTQAFGPNEVHVGIASSELADIQVSRGNFDAAAADAELAVGAFTAALGDDNSYTLIARANLALVRLEQGHSAQALRELDAARAAIAPLKDMGATLTGIDFGRARALTDLGRAGEALSLLKALDDSDLAQSSWGPRDARWELQAETARAQLRLRPDAAVRSALQAALRGLAAAGAHPWLLARYRALL